MFKVTISGEVDEDEEYIKEILALENRKPESLADVDDPVTLAEVLLSASNTRPVSVSVTEQKVTYGACPECGKRDQPFSHVDEGQEICDDCLTKDIKA